MRTSLTRQERVTLPKQVRAQLGLRTFDTIEVGKADLSLEEVAGRLPWVAIPIEELPAKATAERATGRPASRT